MSRRERVLAMLMGGTILGLGAVWLVQRAVMDPIFALKEDIGAEQKRRAELNNDLLELRRVEKTWQALTEQTVATDPKQAQLLFRAKLHELMERHGLAGDPDSQDAKISPGAFTQDKNDFVRVPMTINTRGTLKELVGFLRDFYRLDLLARIEKIDLNADQRVINEAISPDRGRNRGRSNRRGRTARNDRTRVGPDGPELTIKITAATVVLPKVRGIEAKPTAEIAEREIEDPALYDPIFKDSLFKPYEPPVVAVKPPDPEPTKPAPEPDPEPEPVKPTPVAAKPPPRRANFDRVYLRGTSVLNGVPVAYVYDETKPTEPPEIFFHDDTLDYGTVLLIHPHGLVVRVDENGRDVDYFYPLGASFGEREPLTPAEHPQVWARLAEEFVGWGGSLDNQ